MSQYSEVGLSVIKTNPNNPRKSFDGHKFDELVASVKEKGVIEPIIIRPTKTKGAVQLEFEIVAGERRYRAAKKAGHDHIPSIIRKLSDDEAFDFMTIENLIREDLTELEEAESFKKYLKKRGDGALVDLAQRTAIAPAYIRKRVSILSLPKYILEAWDEGSLKFGHLVQFLRLKDSKDILAAFNEATDEYNELTVADLKEHIDDMSPNLSDARFNKTGCLICPQNSDIQIKLFDLEKSEKVKCLDQRCFRQKQNNALTRYWKTHGKKKYGTNGFRFYGKAGQVNRFYYPFDKPSKDCHDCPDFVSIVHMSGTVYDDAACVGPTECFNKKRAHANKVRDAKRKGVKIAELESGPRVEWHGRHFREIFWKKRIPEQFQEFKADDEKMVRLALFALYKSNGGLRYKLKDHKMWQGDKPLFDHLSGLGLAQLYLVLKKMVLDVIMQEDFNEKGRRAAAQHLGVDLAKEWQADEEYLERKTKKEMMEFGKKSGIFKEKAVIEYLNGHLKRKKFEDCKKGEMISLFLKTGIDLVGKVPDEITNK